jgi:hypothetical protein
MSKEKKQDKKKTIPLPPTYEEPKISSEDLMAFAAACNGTSSGGRKATAGGPTPCNARKLNS